MNIGKFVYLFASLAFLLSSAGYIPHADAQTVHALLVIMDDDPKIGAGAKVDKKRMQQLLGSVQNGICEVKITTLLSSQDTATREKTLSWVKNINAAADDIIFIHYSGHGGMTENGQTFLATEGKWLFRSELVNAIEQVRLPRLTILTTDCCSSLVQSNLKPMLQESRGMTRLTERVLRNLFLEHKGFLHLTGATEKQYAWSNSRTGGWFTRNFIEALDSNPDENQDSFLSWEEVFVKTRENTEKTFRQTTFTTEQQSRMNRLGITSQTPKAYSLPIRLDEGLKTEERKVVNFIFIVLVLSTLGISSRVSRKLKKQYASRARLSSHRGKMFAVIVVEVLIWIGFNVFWQFSRVNWMFICIIGVLLIGIILSRQKKRYA